MKNKITGIITAVFGIILAVGVMTVFHACAAKDDGTWMHCHDVQNYAMCLGIGIAVISLIAVIVKNRAANISLNIVNAVLAVIAMLLPGTIMSMCMMHTMRCYSVMRPFIWVMGVLIIISALINVITAVKER